MLKTVIFTYAIQYEHRAYYVRYEHNRFVLRSFMQLGNELGELEPNCERLEKKETTKILLGYNSTHNVIRKLYRTEHAYGNVRQKDKIQHHFGVLWVLCYIV